MFEVSTSAVSKSGSNAIFVISFSEEKIFVKDNDDGRQTTRASAGRPAFKYRDTTKMKCVNRHRDLAFLCRAFGAVASWRRSAPFLAI